MFEKHQILLNKISHRYLVTTKLIVGERASLHHCKVPFWPPPFHKLPIYQLTFCNYYFENHHCVNFLFVKLHFLIHNILNQQTTLNLILFCGNLFKQNIVKISPIFLTNFRDIIRHFLRCFYRLLGRIFKRIFTEAFPIFWHWFFHSPFHFLSFSTLAKISSSRSYKTFVVYILFLLGIS
jgi:hypothetical protein